MKIAIGYPPIESEKGTPLLSQNRQFQYFSAPTYIYPMVPAYAASLAKTRGYQVVWMDGIASKQTYVDWLTQLEQEKPDLLLMETKSPVVKKHWKIVDEIKAKFPQMLVVLVGDHVTYDPQESMNNCLVDYILTGGDYDFLLSDLADALTQGVPLIGGIWGRKGDTRVKLNEIAKYQGNLWISGPLVQKHNLDELPFIDRDLTHWELYAYENGNFKYKPGTYVYSGRDCWWGRCTFCIWNHSLNSKESYRSFSPERLFAEVKHVVDNYQVKEVFDDAGTFFVGPKLKNFCELLIDSGYNKKVVFSCNMRLKALSQEEYDLMGKANFRYILYGMESGNQETLDRLDKGLKLEEIEKGVSMAKKAGLEPHITVMLGYPWETEEMAKKTIALAKDLFRKGYVDTMQATVTIPYPGTPLYKECVEKGWFNVDPKDYESFDMRKPVMKIPFSEERLHEMTQELYSSFITPQYFIRKILSIRKWDDVKFYMTAAKKLLGHLTDFDKNQTKDRGLIKRLSKKSK